MGDVARRMRSLLVRCPSVVVVLAALLVWAALPVTVPLDREAGMLPAIGTRGVAVLCVALLALLCAAAVALRRRGRLHEWEMVALLLAAGFVVRAGLVLSLGYASRQHDSYVLSLDRGHLSYVLWFVDHNFALPDFNPLERWSYYHPPLYHLIAALWVVVQRALGLDVMQAAEGLQFIGVVTGVMCCVVIVRILREMGFSGPGLVVPAAVTSLHPALVFQSMLINNDLLCLALSLQAFLLMLRWHADPTLRRAICVGVVLGLATMVKTNGILMLAPIGVVFLHRAIVNGTSGKGVGVGALVGQAAAFLAVLLPLACWWHVYLLLRFGIAPGTITAPGEDDMNQYVGGRGVLARLTGLDVALGSPYVRYAETVELNAYSDYNPTTTLFKTIVFDENPVLGLGRANMAAAWGVFLVNVALTVVSGVGFVRGLADAVRMRAKPLASVAAWPALAVLFVVLVGFYYSFCFKYPFTCTENFRYIMPTLLVGLAGLGRMVSPEAHGRRFSRSPRAGMASRASTALAVVFCGLCLLMFLAMTWMG